MRFVLWLVCYLFFKVLRGWILKFGLDWNFDDFCCFFCWVFCGFFIDFWLNGFGWLVVGVGLIFGFFVWSIKDEKVMK